MKHQLFGFFLRFSYRNQFSLKYTASDVPANVAELRDLDRNTLHINRNQNILNICNVFRESSLSYNRRMKLLKKFSCNIKQLLYLLPSNFVTKFVYRRDDLALT